MQSLEFGRKVYRNIRGASQNFDSCSLGPDGVYLATDVGANPLFQYVPDTFYKEVEYTPEDINPGDLLIFRYGDWHLGVVTEETVFRRPLLYLGNPKSPRYLCTSNQTILRIAKNIDVPIPPVLETRENHFRDRVRAPITLESDRNTFLDKPYTLQEIPSPKDIRFIGDSVVLEHDYLYRTKRGVPIIISDFHQKLAWHIAELIQMKILPNTKPIVEWLDEHDDLDTSRNKFLSVIRSHSRTPSDIAEMVSKIDCGQAASLVIDADIADIAFFRNFSIIEVTQALHAFDFFSYRHPLARMNDRPHILSYETDHAKAIYNHFASKHSAFLDFLADYILVLENSGMTPRNFDAVCLYTAAPNYCPREVSEIVMNEIIEAFD